MFLAVKYAYRTSRMTVNIFNQSRNSVAAIAIIDITIIHSNSIPTLYAFHSGADDGTAAVVDICR